MLPAQTCKRKENRVTQNIFEARHTKVDEQEGAYHKHDDLALLRRLVDCQKETGRATWKKAGS